MKVKATISNFETPNDTWIEELELPNGIDPIEGVACIIAHYNDTIEHPNDKPRAVHSVEVINEDTKPDHDWSKTNLVTIMPKNGGQSYDTVRCTTCGVTGRRYGFGNEPKLDRKFKAKCYQRCDTALVQFARRAGKK